MRRVLVIIGYVFLGAAVLLAGANEFIRVTGGPHGEGQGIITFFVSEMFSAKQKNVENSTAQHQDAKNNAKWKEAEKNKLHYMDLSYEELAKAEKIFSEKTPETFSSHDLHGVVQALGKALSYAELVSDDVLDSIHPEMRVQFRQNYQTGLLKMLNGFKNRDQKSAIEGSKLYEKYRTWAFSHHKEFSPSVE